MDTAQAKNELQEKIAKVKNEIIKTNQEIKKLKMRKSRLEKLRQATSNRVSRPKRCSHCKQMLETTSIRDHVEADLMPKVRCAHDDCDRQLYYRSFYGHHVSRHKTKIKACKPCTDNMKTVIQQAAQWRAQNIRLIMQREKEWFQ